MLESYRQHAADRAQLGIPPLPLSAPQTAELCELLKHPPAGEEECLVELLRDRVPLGVDQAAYMKVESLKNAKANACSQVFISYSHKDERWRLKFQT